jgi:TDG/mug DNA glycosylase family protein
MRRLSRADEEFGQDRSVPDLIARNLGLLLVGINPSLSSGATGYHFATPGNRLWPAMYGAGLTERLIEPDETAELIACGIGITNLVNRATRTAAEVQIGELRDGAVKLRSTVALWRPTVVAVLGIGAFRRAFDQPRAQKGRQPAGLGASQLWLLPNPSGINAYYSVARLIELFHLVREARNEATRVC